MFKPKHRRLVFVRAGDDSLHPQWIDPKIERNWDLFVSYYDNTKTEDKSADFFVAGGLSKFQHLKELIKENPDFFFHYDYIWVVDPDVAISPQGIENLFDISTNYHLAISQPSLSHNSFINHPITAHHPSFILRRTNFVEVMCPMFSRNALRVCWESFDKSISSFGLDVLWSYLLNPEQVPFAVIDEVQAKHSKPLDIQNGAWYQFLREHNIDHRKEYNSIFEFLGIENFQIKMLSAIQKNHGLIKIKNL